MNEDHELDVLDQAPVAMDEERTPPDEPAWSWLRCWAFRIAFLFVLLFPMPGGKEVGMLAEWLGLGPVSSTSTGSGDTLHDWVKLLAFALVALAAGTIWSLIDRRRRRPRVLFPLLLILARYFLAMVSFSYGFAKVFKTQFPAPFLTRLVQDYGDSSPMGLAWTFMGQSLPYNVFTGGGEVLGGLLLLFRRTRALGALVVVAVMSNVVMLNFCYDIPVKINSTYYLLLALGLLLPDLRRLADVLVFNRRAEPADLSPYFGLRWANVATRVVKWLVIGWIAIPPAHRNWEGFQRLNDREGTPLYGIHEVESFLLDGEEVPPLLTDQRRWDSLIVEWPGGGMTRKLDGGIEFFRLELADDALTLSTQGESYPLALARPEPGLMVLTGPWRDGQELEVRLREKDLNDFELVGRGFHWVSERPYNR
ncbi:MAG: hypothetical protein AAF533_23990 [Acidobacteriota bacterium]